MQDSAVKTYDCDRKALVHKLMEIIAAPADSEYLAEPASLEEFAFDAGELSRIATKLLKQMLELYGECTGCSGRPQALACCFKAATQS